MKPNLRTFVEYIEKYPSKRVCLRVLYKDYSVEKEDRESWRNAYDYVLSGLENAEVATQETKGESEEVEVEGREEEELHIRDTEQV